MATSTRFQTPDWIEDAFSDEGPLGVDVDLTLRRRSWMDTHGLDAPPDDVPLISPEDPRPIVAVGDHPDAVDIVREPMVGFRRDDDPTARAERIRSQLREHPLGIYLTHREWSHTLTHRDPLACRKPVPLAGGWVYPASLPESERSELEGRDVTESISNAAYSAIEHPTHPVIPGKRKLTQTAAGHVCGRDYVPVEACGARTGGRICGHPFLQLQRCGSHGCESDACWRGSLWETTLRVIRRFMAWDLYLWRQDHPFADVETWEPFSCARLIHGVVSPAASRDDHLTLDQRDGFRDACKTLIQEAGYEGWLSVDHPWRLSRGAKQLLRDAGYGPVEGSKGGYWTGARQDAADLGSWRVYTERGPHQHIVGFSGRRDTDDAWIQDSGEVGDNMDVCWRVRDLYEPEDVGRTVGYLLTHAASHPRRHLLAWLGELANCKFSEKQLEPDERRRLDAAMTEYEDTIAAAIGYEPPPDDACPACGSHDRRSLVDLAKTHGARAGNVVHYDKMKRALTLLTEGLGREKGPPVDTADENQVKRWLCGHHPRQREVYTRERVYDPREGRERRVIVEHPAVPDDHPEAEDGALDCRGGCLARFTGDVETDPAAIASDRPVIPCQDFTQAREDHEPIPSIVLEGPVPICAKCGHLKSVHGSDVVGGVDLGPTCDDCPDPHDLHTFSPQTRKHYPSTGDRK